MTDELAAPPQAEPKRRILVSAIPEPTADSAQVLAQVAPVPCRRAAQRLYTVAELEKLLQQKAPAVQLAEIPVPSAEDVDAFANDVRELL